MRARAQVALPVLGLLAAACVLRLPAHDMPLNRDEATYAMIGDQGGLDLLPYRDLFDNKQPLIYAVYWALARIAPHAVGAMRLTTALVAGAAALAGGAQWLLVPAAIVVGLFVLGLYVFGREAPKIAENL